MVRTYYGSLYLVLLYTKERAAFLYRSIFVEAPISRQIGQIDFIDFHSFSLFLTLSFCDAFDSIFQISLLSLDSKWFSSLFSCKSMHLMMQKEQNIFLEEIFDLAKCKHTRIRSMLETKYLLGKLKFSKPRMH